MTRWCTQKCCAALERSRAKDDKISTSGRDGGYMIPSHSKAGQGMRIHLEKLVNWHGKDELIPIYLASNIFNFYLNREVKSTHVSILICRDSRYGQMRATCCERNGPTAYTISFLVGFIKDLDFRKIILKCDSEPSTKARQDAVIHACVGVEVIPQGLGQWSCGNGCEGSETTV